MMKRWFVLLLVGWCACLSMHAAGGFAVIEIGGGGGWGSMGYKTKQHDQSALQLQSTWDYSYTAHVGLAYMIRPYIGLGVGANFTRIGGGVRLGGEVHWQNVGDTENELYNHVARLDAWQEKQQMLLVEIPIGLRFGAGIGARVEFTGEVGVKIGLPMKTSNTLSGTVTHEGDYSPWGLNLQNVGNHGFYTAAFGGEPALSTRTHYAAYLKAGIQVPLTENRVVWFYAQIYGSYALSNALKTGDGELGFRNDGKYQTEAHAFMADYTSIVDTRYVQSVHPVQAGLEVGLRFHLAPRSKYPCHCVNDQPYL